MEARRVLLVEDQRDLARGITLLLEHSGFEVRMLHEGTEVHSVSHAFRPRFLLLDIGLPGMDGYQVADQIRSDSTLDGILIIAISAYPPDQRAQTSRFDFRFVKPVDFSALLALLNSRSFEC